jgi:hypothetical protein
VNGGAAQRSDVRSVAIQFDQNVIIADPATAVQLTKPDGSALSIPAGNYSYDSDNHMLTIDFSGVNGLGYVPSRAINGVFSVIVNQAGIVAAANPTVQLAASQTLRFHQLLADLNGNKVVDAADETILMQHFGAQTGDPHYSLAADLNKNGWVETTDWAIWRNSRGQKTETYTPGPDAWSCPP